MQIMQDGNNWIWFAAQAALTVMTIVAVWYLTIIGRDRNPNSQRHHKESLTRYADVEEDHSPLPKFLIWTYVGFAVWAVVYLIITGMNGIY